MRKLHHFHIMLAAVAMALTAVGVFAQTAPRFLSGPAVTDITADGAVVRWTTDMAGTTTVDFGLTTDLGQTYRKIIPIEESEVVETDHAMTLQALEPSTVYHYRVRTVASDGSSAMSELRTFTTAAAQVTASASYAPTVLPETTPIVAAPVETHEPVSAPHPEAVKEAEAPREVEPVAVAKPELAVPESPRKEAVPVPTSVVEPAPKTVAPASAPETPSALVAGRIRAQLEGAVRKDTCTQLGIPAERCAAWLDAKYADPSCEDAGVFTREACEKRMEDGHGGTFPGCVGLNDEECSAVKSRALTGYLPDDVKKDIDAVVRTKTVAQAFEEFGDAAPEIVAVRKEKIGGVRWWPSAVSDGSSAAVGVIVFDADKDGLPDQTEIRLGTNPNDADTDGNGMNDKEQLLKALADQAQAEKDAKKNGTKDGEPEPPAMLRPSAIDLAFLNGKPLEQPFAEGETDAAFHVAADGSAAEKKGVVLSGQADPNTVVLLYVYSYVPMVLTTTTDGQGNFSYDLGDNVVDGKHTVYVALADDEGRISKKSEPLSFFVSEANAATEEQFLRPDVDVKETGVVADATRFYLWGAAALIVLGIIFTWSVSRRMGQAS